MCYNAYLYENHTGQPGELGQASVGGFTLPTIPPTARDQSVLFSGQMTHESLIKMAFSIQWSANFRLSLWRFAECDTNR